MKKTLSVLLLAASFITACKKGNTPNSNSSNPTTNIIVSTLAGSGVLGNTNGTGTASSFNFPMGVTVDAAGNIYVADSENNLIRKITPTGIVSTLAGSGLSGKTNGTGIAASFYQPTSVAVDAAGNVYVADSENNLIRKITPVGIVSTLAGSGTAGSINGTGTAASFNFPQGVAVDATGNVYVAESGGNSLIRKITPAGIVSTLAGGGYGNANGTGTAASFGGPSGVAVDVAGNVYVADQGNNLIRKISSAGVVSTLAGNGVQNKINGTGTAASFNFPYSVAVDAAGNVYVADQGNNLIRKISSVGVVSTLAGNSAGVTNGTGIVASFYTPYGVAVDVTGNVYVADSGNNLIRKIVVQ